jgi:hypothetical protein
MDIIGNSVYQTAVWGEDTDRSVYSATYTNPDRVNQNQNMARTRNSTLADNGLVDVQWKCCNDCDDHT